MKSKSLYTILILTMKRFLLICILILGVTHNASSQTTPSTLRIRSYYPVPNISFYQFLLSPILEQTGLPCPIGTFYNNTDDGNRLYYCRDSGAGVPISKWDPLPEVWLENQDEPDILIYPADQTNPQAKKIGIGTSTPAFKLTLEHNAGILAKGAFNSATAPTHMPLSDGAYFIWWTKKAALRAGTVNYNYNDGVGVETDEPNRTAWDPTLIGSHSVAFGYNTRAVGNRSVVASGANNRIGEYNNENPDPTPYCGPYSTIAGGESNQTNLGNAFLTIGGGQYHNLGGYLNSGLSCSSGATYEFVGGGRGYILGKNYTTIIGGEGNYYPTSEHTIPGPYNSIGGGSLTGASQNFDTISFLTSVGGKNHQINPSSAHYGTVAGGASHSLAGQYSFIGGGLANSTTGDFAVIAGGQGNSAASYSSVLGGSANLATGNFSTILGGQNMRAYGTYSSSGGGYSSQSLAPYSFVGGGYLNRVLALSNESAIISGYYNLIQHDANSSGQNSFIGGGQQNTITGNFSAVPGGRTNTVSSNHSLAIGWNMRVNSDNTFAFGAPSVTVDINAPDSFIVYATTGTPAVDTRVGIGTASPSQRLHVMDGNIRIENGSLIIDNPPGTSSPSPLVRDDATGALGFDLAERFPVSEEAQSGDVMVVDTDSETVALRRSSRAYDKRVVGIVSFAPAMVLSSENLEMTSGAKLADSKDLPIALSGRVLCKVSLENGPISYGDLLTTSSLPGHAMKADRATSFGTVIGKALEPFPAADENTDPKQTGTILIMVTLQ